MDICSTCSHANALHVGLTGGCRLNGCGCRSYTEPWPVATEPVAAPLPASEVSVAWFTAVLVFLFGAACFAVGVAVGTWL